MNSAQNEPEQDSKDKSHSGDIASRDCLRERLTADEHMASLVAFATTGIACFKMASCTLLKTVKIYLWDNPRQNDQYGIVGPNEQVEEILERIFRLQLQHNVRRLVICAASRIRMPETADPYSYRRSLRDIWDPSRACDFADVARGETNLAVATWDRDSFFGHNLPQPNKRWYPRWDVDWGRIASLVEHLPVLNEVVFSSEHSFPSNLLEVLHQNHPDCHLYVNKFCRYFSSPLGDASGVLESPSLRGMRFVNAQARAYLPNSVAADLDVATRSAPNLRDVHYGRVRLDQFWNSHPDQSETRNNEPQKPLPKGRLRTLQISEVAEKPIRWATVMMPTTVKIPTLMAWDSRVLFTLLESLKLADIITSFAMDYLQSCSFPTLRSLVIALCPTDTSLEYYQKFNSFLKGMRLLESLRVKDWCHQHTDLPGILPPMFSSFTSDVVCVSKL